VRHALDPRHRVVGRHDHLRGRGAGVEHRPQPELAVRRLEGHAGALHEVFRAEAPGERALTLGLLGVPPSAVVAVFVHRRLPPELARVIVRARISQCGAGPGWKEETSPRSPVGGRRAELASPSG
jgi:hypothetical protein